MFENEFLPITRSTLNDLLDLLSVIRMGSLHNQRDRNLGFRVELKYPKGFIRPEDLSARNVPPEAAGATEPLRFRQIGFSPPEFLSQFFLLGDIQRVADQP